MNNTYKPKSVEFRFGDYLWLVLSQWKVIAVVCIIMAVLYTSIQYAKDLKAYTETPPVNENIIENEEQALSRINEIMDGLTGDDRVAINYLLGVNEKCDRLNHYIDESLLFSVDANNVRTLNLGYCITDLDNESSLNSVKNGYLSTFYDGNYLEMIKSAFDEKTETKYIAELISFPKSDYVPKESGVVDIYIILPSDVDPEAVTHACDDVIQSRCTELSKGIAAHKIAKVYSGIKNTTSIDIAQKQYDVLNEINNLKSMRITALNSLTEGQKATYNELIKLQSVASNSIQINDNPVETSAPKPVVRIKNVVIGMFLGLILYILVLIAHTLIKGRVLSASCAEDCLQSVVLGQYIYDEKKRSLIKRVFNSRLISRMRYKNEINKTRAMNTISKAIVALCSQKNIHSLTLVCFIDKCSEIELLLEHIKTYCNNNSIMIDAIGVRNNDDFESLYEKSSVIPIIGKNTKIKMVEKFHEFVKDFNIELIGTIYTESI